MRDLILQLSKSSIYSTKPIRVEHQESLHPHNAVARIHWKGSKNVT
ncbi:GTP cyclohydrolase, FolE2/MptA family [Klebsiella pneumoniae]